MYSHAVHLSTPDPRKVQKSFRTIQNGHTAHVRNQQVPALGGPVDKRALIVCFLAGFITGTVVGEWNLRRR